MDTAQAPVVEPRQTRRGRSIVGPVILIGLGLLILAQNVGLLPASSWATIVDFWPAVFILIGLELILGRGSWAGAIVIAVLTLVIVGGYAIATNLSGSTDWTFRPGPFVAVETIQVSEELGQTGQAAYDLSYGAGDLSLSALDSGSASLVEGTLERDDRATIEKSVSRQGDKAQVVVRARNTREINVPDNSGTSRMSLRLSPKVASTIVVDGGAGESYLDLRDLKVTSFQVNSGVGGTRVVLPQSAGRTTAKISAGVGGVTITVPQGVAVRIKLDRGLVGADIDTQRFRQLDDDLYQSPDYGNATNQIDLQISTGIGGITVK